MKIRLGIMMMLVLGVCLMAQEVKAASPVQLALFNPVQIVQEYEDISVFRFNLVYGKNYNVSGLDFGMVNESEGMQKGLAVGLYNQSYETVGVQFGLINKTDWLNGVQVGLINLHTNGNLQFFPLINFSF